MTAGAARIAGWRLRRRLGEGSHGSVHEAVREADGAVAALKLVPLESAEAAAAFLRLAARAMPLRHPDIVELRDAGVEGSLGWLAMELVPGADLASHTHAPHLLPEPLVLHIGERLARALAHAHRQGLVHRDLKPANVLVHPPGDIVKLADLGLVRGREGDPTGTGVVPGSPAYMAPEQLAGAVPDAASDLYALGVTLFELLAGCRPHEARAPAESMGELLRRVAREPATPLAELRPDLPPALSLLLAGLLERERARRPRDGDAVAAALAAVRAGLPVPPRV